MQEQKASGQTSYFDVRDHYIQRRWNDPRSVFIRAEVVEGSDVFAIYDGSNGDFLGHQPDQETAIASAIQYGMTPASVH